MPRRFLILIVASVISLVGVGVWAQVKPDPTPRRPYQRLTLSPDVLSGESIGVRVSGVPDQQGNVQGTLVVKINGQWVDVVGAPKLAAPAK